MTRVAERNVAASALQKIYPEIGAGGFSQEDGTVEFFTRVNALLSESMTVLDYGAGRAHWFDGPVGYRTGLRSLRGKVAEVIGIDIDPIVEQNPTLDRAIVSTSDIVIPLPDASVDLIVSDHTFEHVDRPAEVAEELHRVLRPGGWLCARTPNKWGYIAVAARVIPNSAHVSMLRRVQPRREAQDVFPTRYRVNTMRDVERVFPASRFENCSYFWGGEPGYFGGSPLMARAIRTSGRLLPALLQPKIHIFLRKLDAAV